MTAPGTWRPATCGLLGPRRLGQGWRRGDLQAQALCGGCQVVVDGVLVTGEIFMGFHGICVGFVNLWDFCWTVVGILLELNVFLIELRVNGMEWNGISLDLVGFH